MSQTAVQQDTTKTVVDLLQADGYRPNLELPADGSVGPSIVEPVHLSSVAAPQNPSKMKRLVKTKSKQASGESKKSIKRTQPVVLGGKPATYSVTAPILSSRSDQAAYGNSNKKQQRETDRPFPSDKGNHLFDDIGNYSDSDCDDLANSDIFSAPGKGAVKDEALQLVLDADAQKVAHHYHRLKELLKGCRKERRYLEAQQAKEKIDKIRQYEAQRRMDTLNARHTNEVQALNEAYRHELEVFRARREEQFEEFTSECQQQIESLLAQHADEEQKTKETERLKLAERPRPSHELLTLRRIEDNLSRTEAFREAFATRARADALEQEEQLAAQDGTHERIAKALATLYRKHGTELAALKQRHEIKESKLRRALILEEEQLTRKYYNLNAGLLHSQKLQTARMSGLKHHIPAPTITRVRKSVNDQDESSDESNLEKRPNTVRLPPLNGAKVQKDKVNPSKDTTSEPVLFDSDAKLPQSGNIKEQMQDNCDPEDCEESMSSTLSNPSLYGSPTARRIRHMIRRPQQTPPSFASSKAFSAQLSKNEQSSSRRPDTREIIKSMHETPQAPDEGDFHNNMSPLEVLELETKLAQAQPELEEEQSTVGEAGNKEAQNKAGSSDSLESTRTIVEDEPFTDQSDINVSRGDPMECPENESELKTARKGVMEQTSKAPPPGTIQSLHHADFVRNSSRKRTVSPHFSRSRTARTTSSTSEAWVCPLNPNEADLNRLRMNEERLRRREEESKKRHLLVSRGFAQRKRKEEEEIKRKMKEEKDTLHKERQEEKLREEQRRLHDQQLEKFKQSALLENEIKVAKIENEQAQHAYRMEIQKMNARYGFEHAKMHTSLTSSQVHSQLNNLFGSFRVPIDKASKTRINDPEIIPPASKIAPGRIRWATSPSPILRPPYLRMDGKDEYSTLAMPLAEEDDVVQAVMKEIEDEEKAKCERAEENLRRSKAKRRHEAKFPSQPSPSNTLESSALNPKQESPIGSSNVNDSVN